MLTTALRRRGVAVCVFLTLYTASAVKAGAANVGYRDFAFGTDVTAPTSDKPQSKLWFNDGSWWGCLYSPTAHAYHIYVLNLSTQTWSDTNTLVDNRRDAHMDALWDGVHLYIVSGGASSTAVVRRYSYSASTRTYTQDPGFPATVRVGGGESISIAEDSLKHLWVTYTYNEKVWVRHSLTSDTSWGSPYVIPVNGTTITSDDISGILAFQDNKIGVMWSNQVDKKTYFAVHVDGDGDGTWSGPEVVLPSSGGDPSLPWSDDHMNVKEITADKTGRVFGAVKTSLDATGNSSAPLIMLAVRDGFGNWSSYTFGRVSDDHTRPLVIIDDEHSMLYMFATSPTTPGGTIYMKSTPLNSISFPVGLGTPIIQSSTDTAINNVTAAKSNVNSTTGLVVLASDDKTHRYLHNYINLSTSSPIGTLTPAADSYVRDGAYANTNYGSSTKLYVKANSAAGYSRIAYMKFDLMGAAANPVSATLSFDANLSALPALDGGLYQVLDSTWSENTITWNNRPSFGPLIANVTVASTTLTWYRVDVTQYVKAQLAAGNRFVSIGVSSASGTSSNLIQINSRETGSTSPILTLSY